MIDDFDTSRAHPTPDELADLREGLLPAVEADRLDDHVAGCEDCRSVLTAIDAVAESLRVAGAAPVPMPSTVARSIDEALAAESARRADEPALARLEATPRPRRSRHVQTWLRPLGWLGGVAAAVLVLGGVGVTLDQGGGNVDDNASNAESAAADSGAGGGSATRHGARTAPPGAYELLVRLDRENLTRQARRVASGRALQDTAVNGSAAQFAQDCTPPRGADGTLVPARWYGANAFLVVSRETRVASVYSCEATPRLVYSAPY